MSQCLCGRSPDPGVRPGGGCYCVDEPHCVHGCLVGNDCEECIKADWERYRPALELIDREGCTNFTSGRCWDYERQRGAKYGADAWCDACVARDALGEEDGV